MEKINKDEGSTMNPLRDDCCMIAESMIDEIRNISILEGMASSGKGKHKGSFKKMIVRQIKETRWL